MSQVTSNNVCKFGCVPPAQARIQTELTRVCAKWCKTVPVSVVPAGNHADFASNVAFALAKKTGGTPLSRAQKIVNLLSTEKSLVKMGAAKVQAVAPGFVNFWLTKTEKVAVVNTILQKQGDFGKQHHKKRVNVEFVSANPTGFLHVGHARNAAVGDTLCNVMEQAGYHVQREYYVNDAGAQIKTLGRTVFQRYQQLLGHKAEIKEGDYKGQDVQRVAKALLEKAGKKYEQAPYSKATAVFFEGFASSKLLSKIKEHLQNFNVTIPLYFSEKSLYTKYDLPNIIKKMPQTYVKDNALWLNTSKFGDDKDRVIKKSDGTYTYFAPDLAYHKIKVERDGGYDKLVDVWGADHSGYIKRMQTALEIFGYPGTLDVVTIQFVRLVQNGRVMKMSKRAGNSYTLNDLTNAVGVDAARFLLLQRSANSKINFDVGQAQAKTLENPVFYVQYAHARIHQLLQRAGFEPPKVLKTTNNFTDDPHVHETLVLLRQFSVLVQNVAKNYKVHLLHDYLCRLAKAFHSFYNAKQIIGQPFAKEKLTLAYAVGVVLGVGLRLVGVSAPKKMF